MPEEETAVSVLAELCLYESQGECWTEGKSKFWIWNGNLKIYILQLHASRSWSSVFTLTLNWICVKGDSIVAGKIGSFCSHSPWNQGAGAVLVAVLGTQQTAAAFLVLRGYFTTLLHERV